MKNFLLISISVLLFSACKQNSPGHTGRNIQLLPDSIVLHNNNIYTDTTSKEKLPVPQTVQKNTTGSIKKSTVARRPANVGTTPAPVTKIDKGPAEAATPPVMEKTDDVTPPVANNSGINNGPLPGEAGSASAGTGTTPTAETEKKGISKAAKGAVIGGAAGAVGGAIISKKKGVGAVIGGIVGAAGGYIIGKTKDKKDSTEK